MSDYDKFLLELEEHIEGQSKIIMMNANDIKHYCLEKHKAQETYPFGDVPICYFKYDRSCV